MRAVDSDSLFLPCGLERLLAQRLKACQPGFVSSLPIRFWSSGVFRRPRAQRPQGLCFATFDLCPVDPGLHAGPSRSRTGP